jgi:hypothetical protein
MLEPTLSASISSKYHEFQPEVRLTDELLCSNMLALVPDGEEPRSRIVAPKLSYMDERIAAIDLVVAKLVRCAFSALSLRPVSPLSV